LISRSKRLLRCVAGRASLYYMPFHEPDNSYRWRASPRGLARESEHPYRLILVFPVAIAPIHRARPAWHGVAMPRGNRGLAVRGSTVAPDDPRHVATPHEQPVRLSILQIPPLVVSFVPVQQRLAFLRQWELRKRRTATHRKSNTPNRGLKSKATLKTPLRRGGKPPNSSASSPGPDDPPRGMQLRLAALLAVGFTPIWEKDDPFS
jgi:hypothetical protein